MSSEVDRTAFLMRAGRLEIARLCREEELSLGELAAKLGRNPGSLSQPRTMLVEGALVRGRRRSGVGGRSGSGTYLFNEEWGDALEKALRSRVPAWPSTGQDLLLVPLADAEAACRALARGVPPEVEWGARVRGAMTGLVIAPAASAGERGALQVIEALGPIGTRVHELHLANVMSPNALHAWCAGEGRPGRELRTGS